MIIANLIHSTPTIPHSSKGGCASIVVEAITKSVSFLIHWCQSRHDGLQKGEIRLVRVSRDHMICSAWDLDGRLPPSLYSIDDPSLSLHQPQVNKIIKQNIIILDIERTWVSLVTPLEPKMHFYIHHLLRLRDNGFITCSRHSCRCLRIRYDVV